MNPNDAIRRKILSWFYARNDNATSHYGKKGSAAKISDVKRGLKADHELTQKEVVSNLTYLIDKGWINRSEIEKTFQVKGGTVPSTTVWYVISSSGIDRIEGESEFQEGGKFAGINITATGNSVVTLGDGNVVNVKFEELHKALSSLRKDIAESPLGDSEKFDLAVDVDGLIGQLAKPEPDRALFESVWKRVESVATLGGFVDTVSRVAPLIVRLLP